MLWAVDQLSSAFLNSKPTKNQQTDLNADTDLNANTDLNADTKTSVSSIRLEAEVLLGFVLKKDRVYLYTWPNKALTTEEWALFQTYIERRKKGEPIAYIIEQKEFWSLPFKVTPAVLIPRPETETVVEEVLKRFTIGINNSNSNSSSSSNKEPDNESSIHLLELGTGSGAISIALAKERPHWNIIATDISFPALQVAQHNAKILSVTNIQWICGDWFNAIHPKQKKFHAIISNPPYIADQDPHLIGDLSYEPKNALVSENKGYFALQEIIKWAPNYLFPKAWIFLEHGATQGSQVRKMLKKAYFSNIKTINDLAGVNRVTVAQYKK